MVTAPPNNTRLLLVCEGEKDELFFRRFINENHLHAKGIHVLPSRGNSKFAQAIRAFRVDYPQKFKVLRAILIVADKNDAVAQRRTNAFEQIENIHGAHSRPAGEMQPSTGVPPIYLLLLPTHKDAGHLESQCIFAAQRADIPAGHVTDTVIAVTNADLWASESRRDKFWLRTNLALRGFDPFMPLGNVFSDPHYHHLIPVVDGAYAALLAAIQQLP